MALIYFEHWTLKIHFLEVYNSNRLLAIQHPIQAVGLSVVDS